MAFKVYEKELSGICILRVAAGTTGYCGGDTGHGGRTRIELEDLGSTDIHFTVKKKNGERKFLIINLGGDAELDMIIEAFEFVTRILRGKREQKSLKFKKIKE